MAKRIYFGWMDGISKETKKPYRMIAYGQESEFWHGIEVKTRFVPIDMTIPDVSPGTMLDITFDDRGNIEEVTVAK